MKPRRVKISSEPRVAPETPTETAAATVDDRIERHHDDAHPASAIVSRRPGQRALLAVSIALVLTYVLTAIALDLFLDPDRVSAWVEPRASAALNRDVSIGEARVDLVPRPSLRLRDVAVDNPAGFDGPTLAHLDEVRLDVSWLQLAIGRLVVRRVHLDAPRVHLAIAEDGTSNFGDLAPRRRSTAQTDGDAESPLRARIRRVTMSGGSLSFFDAARDRSFMTTESSGRAELEVAADGTWLADVTIESDSLHVRAPSVFTDIRRAAGPTARLTVRGDASGDITLDDGRVVLATDTLMLGGTIAGFAGERPFYDIRLTNERLSATALEAIFSPEQRARLLPLAEGSLALTVEMQGGLAASDRPVVRGTTRLDDVTLRLRGDVVAEGVDGFIQFDSSQIAIQALTGRFAGGPFDVQGVIVRDDRLTTTLLTSARTDLDALDRLGVLPQGLTLSGSGEIEGRITGSLRAVDSLQATGTITLDGAHVEHQRLAAPIYVPAGVLSIDGRSVRWNALQVLVGSRALTTSGEIRRLTIDPAGADARPEFVMEVTGPHLDLDVLLPPGPDGPHVSYPQLAFAHLGRRPVSPGDATASARALIRPTGAPATGSISIVVDTLTYRGYRLERLATTLTLTDSTLSMPEATFATWGGEGRAALQLALGSAAEQPFSVALDLQAVSAEAFFANLTPIGGGIFGAVDVDFEARGLTDGQLLPVLDSLTGTARLSIRDGRLANTGVNAALADFLEADQWSTLDFASWTTDLVIRDRVLEVRSSDLAGSQGRVVFDGVLGFGGDSDVSVALSIPAHQLTLVSLRRTGIGPGVLQQLRSSGRALDLGLHMSGPLGAPSLEPDATRAVSLAGR